MFVIITTWATLITANFVVQWTHGNIFLWNAHHPGAFGILWTRNFLKTYWDEWSECEVVDFWAPGYIITCSVCQDGCDFVGDLDCSKKRDSWKHFSESDVYSFVYWTVYQRARFHQGTLLAREEGFFQNLCWWRSLSRWKTGVSAAICRSRDNGYLVSWSLVLPGPTDSATLEILACCEALSVAEDLSIPMIIISCDCKRLVKDILERGGGTYEAIVKEFSIRASNSVSCLVTFEGRASNLEAHLLAKHSAMLDQGCYLWLTPPHDPSCIPLNIHIVQIKCYQFTQKN